MVRFPVKALAILILAMLSSCLITKRKTSIVKTANLSSTLRLDGFYYQIGNDGYVYPFCFLYTDGTLRYIGGRYKQSELNEKIQKIINVMNYSDVNRDDRLTWGVYNIEGSTINIEKWYSKSGWYKPLLVRSGKIDNDTTFTITEIYKSRGEKKIDLREKHEIYHFQIFNNKPDSVNKFIH